MFTHPPETENKNKKDIVLFIPDFSSPYPLYRKVFSQYFAKDRPDKELLIYLSEHDSTPDNLRIMDEILCQYKKRL